jgi:signal transduction histidine kinase
LIYIFAAYPITFYINNFLIDIQTIFRHAVDILFFLGISYVVVREFAANKNKIDEQNRILNSQATDVELGKSTARIAHDLRKPFINLRLALNIVEDQNTEVNPVARVLGPLKESIGYAEGLIEDILNNKRQSLLKLEKIETIEFVRYLEALLLKPVEAQSVQVQLKTDVSGTLYIDKPKMASVFQNIIGNAVEAMEAQSVKKIRVFLSKVTDSIGKAKCRILIRNNGPAIPHHVLDQLFKQGVSFGEKNGTGLGLSGVMKIISDHGGSIICYNLPFNTGVEFEIFLPLELEIKDDSINNLPIVEHHLNLGKLEFEGTIKNAVVVDDDPLIHMTWQLLRGQVDIKFFSSPEEFLSAIEAQKVNFKDIDVIITDRFFNEKSAIDGIVFAKNLIQLSFNRRILSSGSGGEVFESSDRRYFIDFLNKENLSTAELKRRYRWPC